MKLGTGGGGINVHSYQSNITLILHEAQIQLLHRFLEKSLSYKELVHDTCLR